jgi:hypothetical protein
MYFVTIQHAAPPSAERIFYFESMFFERLMRSKNIDSKYALPLLIATKVTSRMEGGSGPPSILGVELI